MADKGQNGSSITKKRIEFAKLKDGRKGVAIGEEYQFLHVNRDNGKFCFRLYDLELDKPVTGPVTLRNAEKLRTSHNAKHIRQHLEKVLEQVITVVEDNKEEWKIKEETKEDAKFDVETEEAIQNAIESVLKAQNQLEALSSHLDNVIVGEKNTKHVAFVLLTSSKYPNPKMKILMILKGTAGGGKTTVAREIAKGYDTKEVGRFTRHGLDHSNLSDVQILYIKELGKMDEEDSGVSTLKFLSADDLGFTVEYPIRDELTGKWRTEQHRIPPINVMTTTTRLQIDSQLERRAWIINIDETEELTRKVLEAKALREEQESEKELGLRRITDYEFSTEVLKRYVKQLDPETVIIPFTHTLVEIYDPKFLRLRGDIDKIFMFLKLYACFNIKRLWKISDRVYAITPEVGIEALNLINNILLGMLTGIEKRTVKLLETLKEISLTELFQEGAFKVTPNQVGSVITYQIRQNLATILGRSQYTIRDYLNSLVARGVMSANDKKPKEYTLLFSVDDILKKIQGETGVLENLELLKDKMEKGARSWLKSKLNIDIPESESISPEVESTPSRDSIPDTELGEEKRDSSEKTEKVRVNVELPEKRVDFVKSKDFLKKLSEFYDREKRERKGGECDHERRN